MDRQFLDRLLTRALLSILACGISAPAYSSQAESPTNSPAGTETAKADGVSEGENETREEEERRETFADAIEVVEDQEARTDTATLVEREEIDIQRASVAYDALEKSPGLHLRSRLGATGAGLSRLTIRGNGASGPAGLGVFVDGRPDSSVSFAHPAPSAHSLESVERIEVIHGPSPVLHGAGKTGVINITTGRPGLGWAASLQVSGGSHQTAESYLRSSYGWDGGFFRFGGTYRETDGHNPDSDAEIKAGNVRFGVTLAEHWDLEVGAGQTDDHFSVFGVFFVPGPFGNPGTTDVDLKQTVADVKLNGAFDRVRTSLQLWYDDLDPVSQTLALGVRRGETSEQGLRFKAHLFADRETSWIVGVDVLDAEARNTPGVPPGRSEQDESLTEIGPYVFAEHQLSERAEVRGGLRFVDHSDYGSETAAELGITYRLNAEAAAEGVSSVRARATHGYQSPTLQQLFGVFRGGPAGLANPDLEPEILDQYELGYHRRSEAWELDLVAFLQDGSDLIQTVAGRLQNSGEFSHSGFEGRLSLQTSRDVSLDVGATWLDLEDNILSVPDTTIDLGLLYRPAALSSRDATLRVLTRWADGFSDRITPLAPIVELDSYFVADAKFRIRAWESGYLFAEVDNLTDEDYQTVTGIPMPGLSGYAGLSVEF